MAAQPAVRYLVDADWLIDAASGQPLAVRTLDRLSSEGLAVSIIAVAEGYKGAYGTSDPEAALANLRGFLSVSPGFVPSCAAAASSSPISICSSPPLHCSTT